MNSLKERAGHPKATRLYSYSGGTSLSSAAYTRSLTLIATLQPALIAAVSSR